MSSWLSKTTLKRGIVVPSFLFIIGVSLLAALVPALTEGILNSIKLFIFTNLNGVYVWTVTIFVIFLIYLMFNKYGNIRLGKNDSRPE